MDKRGFTLLEVTLFLAIASMLAVVAIIALVPRMRNVQFSDAVRSLEQSINSQLSRGGFGENTGQDGFSCRAQATDIVIQTAAGQKLGESEDCVINGRLIYFTDTSVTSYQIASLRQPRSGCTDSGLVGVANCFNSSAITSSSLSPAPQEITLRNGLEPIPVVGNQKGFGYLQDPNGTAKYLFTYSSAGSLSDVESLRGKLTPISAGSVFERCFSIGPRDATISFSGNKFSVDAEFNSGCSKV